MSKYRRYFAMGITNMEVEKTRMPSNVILELNLSVQTHGLKYRDIKTNINKHAYIKICIRDIYVYT